MAQWQFSSGGQGTAQSRDFSFNLRQQTLLMGICNITPDSFSDGGATETIDTALSHALAMQAQGATMIDVGGESTRPNYAPVSVEDELQRVLPLVSALAAQGVCVSIDTHKPSVMAAALAAGAAIVNDVNALHAPQALDLVLNCDCGVVILDGFSQVDQTAKRAGLGLLQRLAMRYATLTDAGIAPHRIVIDPGIGFDKNLEDNLDCIKLLPQLRLIAPVLIGGSRKSLLGAITGQAVHQRLAGSVALAMMAAQRGAAVLRVHDVAATADALKVMQALRD